MYIYFWHFCIRVYCVAQLLDKLCKYFSHMGFKMKSSLTKTQLYVRYVLIRIPQLGRTWLYVGLVAFFLFLFFSQRCLVCFCCWCWHCVFWEANVFCVWNQEEGIWVMTEHRCCWLLNVVGQFILLFSIIWNCNCLY